MKRSYRKVSNSGKRTKRTRRPNGLSGIERQIMELLKQHTLRMENTGGGNLKFFLDNGKVFIAPVKLVRGKMETRTAKNSLAQLKRLLRSENPANPRRYNPAARSNPDRMALRRALQGAREAALAGDPRAVVVLRSLERQLAEEVLEDLEKQRRKEANNLRRRAI